MSTSALSKDAEQVLQDEFKNLLEETSSPTRFTHMILKWLSFITGIISKHGIKSTDATRSYKLADGYPTWNKNEDIIPALGKKLSKEMELFLKPETIHDFMQGLRYFETLFMIYKDNAKEGVRLTRITKTPMAELFVHTGYRNSKEALLFLLNLPEKDFQWIKELVEAGGEKDMVIEKETLTRDFKELFFLKKELPISTAINDVKYHKFRFPEKEIMYGWVLEKYPKIPTGELERIVDNTRSIVLAQELKKRPATELSFGAFLTTVED